MKSLVLTAYIYLLLPPNFLCQPLFGNQPKVWLTVSSLVEKLTVNGQKFITKRKIEMNWMNLPVLWNGEEDLLVKKELDASLTANSENSNNKNGIWVALFDHDQNEPNSDTALVSLQPKLVSRGRFR